MLSLIAIADCDPCRRSSIDRHFGSVAAASSAMLEHVVVLPVVTSIRLPELRPRPSAATSRDE